MMFQFLVTLRNNSEVALQLGEEAIVFSNFRMPEGAIRLGDLSCIVSSVFDAQDSNIPNSLEI